MNDNWYIPKKQKGHRLQQITIELEAELSKALLEQSDTETARAGKNISRSTIIANLVRLTDRDRFGSTRREINQRYLQLKRENKHVQNTSTKEAAEVSAVTEDHRSHPSS